MTYATTLGQAAGDYGVTIDQLPAQDVAGQAPFYHGLPPLMHRFRDQSVAVGMTVLQLPHQRDIGNWQRARKTDRGTRPVAFDGAKAYLTYDPASQMMVLDQVRVDSRTCNCLPLDT